MYKLTMLFLFLCLQISCDSQDDEDIICAAFSSPSTSSADLLQYIPLYIYATENTSDACYAHGLEVIEQRNSYRDYGRDQCSVANILETQLHYQYQDYKIDTIEEKLIHNFEGLNSAEVEELTNLICGRQNGDEFFEIQSLENFEVNNRQLTVEFMIHDRLQTRTIESFIDSGFNCPLYSFSCSAPRFD